jgi:Na+/H+ antiporter NhaA
MKCAVAVFVLGLNFILFQFISSYFILSYIVYNCVKKKQLDAQLILSIRVFRQPLHVSGVSKPIIRRYNRMYATVGTYYSFRLLSVFLVGLEQSQLEI